MGTDGVRNKSHSNPRGQHPFSSRSGASTPAATSGNVKGGASPFWSQCVSEPAARRISGAATWDSSLR